MDAKNPFEKKIDITKYPGKIKDAAIDVTNTLDLALASAKAIFKGNATPEIALAIYDRKIAKIADSEVSDTLDLALASAEAIFSKEKATPEIVLAIYDRIIAKIADSEAKEKNEPFFSPINSDF